MDERGKGAGAWRVVLEVEGRDVEVFEEGFGDGIVAAFGEVTRVGVVACAGSQWRANGVERIGDRNIPRQMWRPMCISLGAAEMHSL